MGCGGSVSKSSQKHVSSSKTSETTRIVNEFSATNLMASLQGQSGTHNNEEIDNIRAIHVLNINNGKFDDDVPDDIESDNIIEFNVIGNVEYDLFQVYKVGNDYYRVHHGYELLNLSSRTPAAQRRLPLSSSLTKKEIELNFCIIPSKDRGKVLQSRKCPKQNCEGNELTVKRCDLKFPLTDERENRKVTLHKGDTIEIEWKGTSGVGYRIEEKRYCPVSGGLYTVEESSGTNSQRLSISGKYSKTYNEYGMSFLVRYNGENEVHDITTCIINDTYKIKHIEITDENIQPHTIWIEQTDFIEFEWNTKRKQTLTQIDPFKVDAANENSIELKKQNESFSWPHEPSRRGLMYQQFNEAGIYCFKVNTGHIGTIIVGPRKRIHHVPIFDEKLIYKSNTNDFIQLDWEKTDLHDQSILITIDSKSSVIPQIANGLTGIFDCSSHKCRSDETFISEILSQCETFILNIPQHGLYNFSYSNNPDVYLTSIIVENGIDNHPVTYNEQNVFEPDTIMINLHDQVWFEAAENIAAAIYETDEMGRKLDLGNPLFRPQDNSVNYFVKQFSRIGVYYFTTDLDNDDDTTSKTPAQPFTVIVLPEIRFHQRMIRQKDFDAQPILTNMNDFVIWCFEQVVTHNVTQIASDVTIHELASCHEKAIAGRQRQCLGVECIRSGTFFFANPEFERIYGPDQTDRLLSTIVVDLPFTQNCMTVSPYAFFPVDLHIAQNDTVSWTFVDSDATHFISVVSQEDSNNEGKLVANRNITGCVEGIHHIHTFQKPGQYTIRSDHLQNVATVYVDPENTIRSQRKRVQEPRLLSTLNVASEYGTRLNLKSETRDAIVYYTTDGTTPARHFDNVHRYDFNEGIVLNQSGLCLVRAYATEPKKVSSAVITSNVTYVMESQELNILKEQFALWKTGKITISTDLKQPNQIYNTIKIEPEGLRNMIDHFQLFVNGVGHKEKIPSDKQYFSAKGFAGGEQYEVYILAHPKIAIADCEPIPSNKRAFEIKREVVGGGPLITLALSNDQNLVHLMWAHLGDHVTEYIVCVDGIETKKIGKEDLNDFYAVQFHDVKPHKTYLFNVRAKTKNNNEFLTSNTVSVITPLEILVKEHVSFRYFPRIVINDERTLADASTETVTLESFDERRIEGDYKTVALPITIGFRNAVPKIACKRNVEGITLYWKKPLQTVIDSINNYRLKIDNEQYGKPISPDDEPVYQINLSTGKHDCYLEVLPKDEKEEIYRSNTLKIDMPVTSGSKYDRKQIKDPSNYILPQKDIPIPQLHVQTISSSAIRANWYLDRPMPTNIYVANYEVHVRGQEFPTEMISDEVFEDDGYFEHIWYVQNTPFEIPGISDREEYTVFVRALFHIHGLPDIKYMTSISAEVATAKVDPLIDLLPRPLLKVTRVGLQMVHLSWSLDDSVNHSLVKGYRIILNSKPSEMLAPNQHDYELRELKPDTTNEVQVSVTSHPDFVDEKVSEPIRIICPKRPQPPVIQTIRADKPFSITIKWQIDDRDQDELTGFKVYLDGKIHGELDANGRRSFKYDFQKLPADKTYLIYVKALIGQKKLGGYAYQCEIESNASNELLSKCVAPPKGTIPRIEQLHSNGVDIVWDPPVEYDNVKITGYQILKDGKALGKLYSADQRRASIADLETGNQYSFQVVPITDQPGGTVMRTGEKYDPDRHSHYIPGPKLDVSFTDIVDFPKKLWTERIGGHSALVCWSPIDQTSSRETKPDSYKLIIWNDKEFKRDKPKVVPVQKDKTSAQLKDLQADTQYEVQIEAIRKRRHQVTNELYTVSAKSEIMTFVTGAPPDPPSNVYVLACTNTSVRIRFDPFVEHKAELITLFVECQPTSSNELSRSMKINLQPNETEFILSSLTERTEYTVTVFGITEEYLIENRCPDASQLPKKLKPSEWLPNKDVKFTTGGFDPAKDMNIRQATMEAIQLDWKLAKVYGSTKFISQTLRWKLDQGGQEQVKDLGIMVDSATIPGILPSGVYKIALDSKFEVRINLEESDDESTRKEVVSTITKSIKIYFHTPPICVQPELYLTGYTTNTIDLAWNKPNMFNVIEHPEKINQDLKIHRRLLGYKFNINGRQQDQLDENQNRCTLTECRSGEKYKIQLIVKTVVQTQYLDDLMTKDAESIENADDTLSKELSLQMLKSQDLLRSFRANFEFNGVEQNENTTQQKNQIKPLGSVKVNWKVSSTKNISHYILQWRSSKDLSVQQQTVASNEETFTINSCDEKYYYAIEIIIVTNDGVRHNYDTLTIPIPGAPDAPNLWFVKSSDTHFVVEWSEPRTYGIPIVGYQLYVEDKKRGDLIEASLRRAEIPSRINRTYQVTIRALTNNPQRPCSLISPTLSVITTPTTNLTPTIYYGNDDGTSTSFDRNIARIIPLQIDSINEEKLHVDWTSFLPTDAVRKYYIHYTCLNNGEIQTMKVSRRFRHAVVRNLRPGFSYGILVMAVDKNGGILYTSDKTTVQMNAPPNSPIVAISERIYERVKIEWRPAAGYGEIAVVGYKIFVNNRLSAILGQDQLSYTLLNGIPCDTYTVHVQALTNDKNIVSPMSRSVQFQWPGIKPGAFRRIDDGQSGVIIVAWEHPQLEDEGEKLLGFRLFSENVATHAVRAHNEYGPMSHQATIHDLTNGKYILWLEIRGDRHITRSRPITVVCGRNNTSLNRQASLDSAKCFARNQRRLRSPGANSLTPPLRHTQYS